jgi:hypothetical protein
MPKVIYLALLECNGLKNMVKEEFVMHWLTTMKSKWNHYRNYPLCDFISGLDQVQEDSIRFLYSTFKDLEEVATDS